MSGSTLAGAGTSARTVTIGAPPSQPTFLNIEADFTQAYSTTEFAKYHAGVADGYIEKLGELAAALVPPTINPNFPINQNAPTITTPSAPSLLEIDFERPVEPAPFSGVLDLSGDEFPVFSGEAPQLLFPNAPLKEAVGLPASPSVDLNFSYPDVDVELPPAPDLLSINVRQFDGVNFPEFDETSPVLDLIAPRVIDFMPDAPYTSSLLNGLVGEVQARISSTKNGKSTGLPPAVEQNIWNRGRERETKQLADDLDKLNEMEAMGYALPPGSYVDAAIKIRTEFSAKSLGLSREVMIKQAELEQSNMQKAMDIAVQIEGKLIDLYNQTEQRRFDACKYATEAGVSIYNAGVQAYTARVQGYRAAVDVYSAQIAGARAVIEVYTAEIQAEKLKVDANTATITNYKTRVDAALASIEVFKGQISLIQTRAQIEQTKVSVYGEQIKAYAATIGVYSSEVEAYKAGIQAEGTKQQAYQTQAQVYGSLVDAKFKLIEGKIEAFKAQLAAKAAEYDGYKAKVESQAEYVKALAAGNSAIADVYKAEVTGVASYNEAIVKEWEAVNTLSIQIANVGVSAAQANGNLYLTAKAVATEAAKVGATVEAQIAASALGAVTWATHRSRQDSVGNSVSRGYNESKSLNSGSSESNTDSTSHDPDVHYSQSASTSVSRSDSTVHQIQSVE